MSKLELDRKILQYKVKFYFLHPYKILVSCKNKKFDSPGHLSKKIVCQPVLTFNIQKSDSHEKKNLNTRLYLLGERIESGLTQQIGFSD